MKRQLTTLYRDGQYYPWHAQRRKIRWSEKLLDILQQLMILAVFVVFVAFVQTVTAAPYSQEVLHSGAMLMHAGNRSGTDLAPRVNTDVDISINGLLVRSTVSQIFSNPHPYHVEATYLFPLPEGVAVDQLRIESGDNVIAGEIKEKQQAKKIYQQAKLEGKQTSLVEQERPNLFSSSIANIAPHAQIKVTIGFQYVLRPQQGTYRFRFPLAVTPRYVTSSSDATDARRISPPYRIAKEKNQHASIHIELDAGVGLQRLESSYHDIATTHHGYGRYTINLEDETVPLDRDFELVWAHEPGNEPRSLIFTEQRQDAAYHLVMLLPPQEHAVQESYLPREVIFVVDTSGSMSGVSIRQAREALFGALQKLRVEDKFNIIRFNSSTSSLFDDSQPASVLNRARARNYIAHLNASGGTEIKPALLQALQQQQGSESLRQIIFITDGSVSNEAELFKIIQDKIGGSRLFTVGIGSAPNMHFMQKAAQYGRGTYTYISKAQEVQAKMQSLFDKLQRPVMQNIKITADDPSLRVWPQRIADLYVGEPLVFTARTHVRHPLFTISGERRFTRWRQQLQPGQAYDATGVAKLWAHNKISALLEDESIGFEEKTVRQSIVALALNHHLVTPYTSLVAVERGITRMAHEPLHTTRVPLNLPHGQSLGLAISLNAQTGTPMRLYLLWASLLLLCALGLLLLVNPQGYRTCGV